MPWYRLSLILLIAATPTLAREPGPHGTAGKSPFRLAAYAGRSYRTQNFIVSAPTQELAREFGDKLEDERKRLALLWFGKEFPDWGQPAKVSIEVGERMGAGGATSFTFDQGEVFGWQMALQGSREEILRSVIPHEVLHTMMAMHFRKPLPRWADEGMATSMENIKELERQHALGQNFLKSRRNHKIRDLLSMREYPSDILPLYSQGTSLTQLLVAKRGRSEFIKFITSGMESDNWAKALKEHYQIESLAALEAEWTKKVEAPWDPKQVDAGPPAQTALFKP